MGRSPRADIERHEENIRNLRTLIDAGSSDIVRDEMVARKLGRGRRKHPIPRIGQRSGKLTVTGYIRSKRSLKAIIVRCDCAGDEYTIDTHNFRAFKSTRCQKCAKKAAASKRYWVYAEAMPDDEHRSRLLNRLAAAIQRCHNPSDRAYKNYGARGVHVCRDWVENKGSFLRYVQTLPGWDEPALEMDRINVNRGYEPGNIRFITRRGNVNNRRDIADLERKIRNLEAENATLKARIRRLERRAKK